MALRFSIGIRIGTGFSVLILLVIIAFYITYQTLDKSIKINEKITWVNTPSLTELEALKFQTIRSRMLIFNWVNHQKTNHPDKQKLKQLIDVEYPAIRIKILFLSQKWSVINNKKLKKIFKELDELFVIHHEVMSLLPDFDSYEEVSNKFLANNLVEEDGEVYIKTSTIIAQLDELIDRHKFQTNTAIKKMQNSFGLLKMLSKYLGLTIILGGILIAFFTTKSIVKPIKKLKEIILKLSNGIFPSKDIKATNDEIGEMAQALNKLVVGLKSTKDFANAVGSGNFITNYKPLSKNDTLGIALLKMRADLKENEQLLETKVMERTKEVVKQKTEIEAKNKKISYLYREVTDSIKYAKRIQEAILPPLNIVEKILPDSFIYYKPKDIVSGDFYWVEQKENKIYFAAVDCTGHGVPGAFMSILGNNALNEAIHKFNTPAQILDELNKEISIKLHNNTAGSNTNDGMDLTLCCYDINTKLLQYASAYNSFYIIRNKELIKSKTDKFAIGTYFNKPNQKYKNHTFQLEKFDKIYIFSDGYADQFGGVNSKKLLYKNFSAYLIKIHLEPMSIQKELLDNYIKEWKGELEQVDDILVMGISIE